VAQTLAWTIAGSDSSGAAGLQADLRTLTALGLHGASVVTAVTAQSLSEARAVSAVDPQTVSAQIETLARGLPPAVIKIGMLADAATVETVARHLGAAALAAVPVVLDPVLRSTSGRALADAEVWRAIVRDLIPRAALVTPNVPEAEALVGRTLETPADVVDAAKALLGLGARAVVIKGGHARGGAAGLVADFFTDGTTAFWLNGPRLDVRARGTGCTFASAAAAGLARGLDLGDAVWSARAYVARGLRLAQTAADLDASAPRWLAHGGWPVTAEDAPWVTFGKPAPRAAAAFAPTGPAPLGFYPVVDRTEWIRRLAPLGATTIQLRVKDLDADALAREVDDAARFCREQGVRLFVNDH
jgi:hydroxymethylpyrimidine kinase/phosphomethylpyrimidine kinase/thiamine-phosphate diphosphorylase